MGNKLNLKLIDQLFNYLKILKDGDDFIDFNIINSKKYEIEKVGNSFIIKSSDGKCLRLEYKNNVSDLGYGEINYYTLEARYLFQDGTTLLITNGYRKTDYENTVVSTGLEYAYIAKDQQYHILSWNKNHDRLNYTYGLEEHGDNYVYVDGIDRYVISKDLKNIIALNNSKTPDKEELQNFNKDEEQLKIRMILKQIELNGITKQMLVEVIEKLENKQVYVDKALEGYNRIIPKCCKIVEEEKFINQQVLVSTFTKEELIVILHLLNEIVKNNTIDNPKVLKK